MLSRAREREACDPVMADTTAFSMQSDMTTEVETSFCESADGEMGVNTTEPSEAAPSLTSFGQLRSHTRKVVGFNAPEPQVNPPSSCKRAFNGWIGSQKGVRHAHRGDVDRGSCVRIDGIWA